MSEVRLPSVWLAERALLLGVKAANLTEKKAGNTPGVKESCAYLRRQCQAVALILNDTDNLTVRMVTAAGLLAVPALLSDIAAAAIVIEDAGRYGWRGLRHVFGAGARERRHRAFHEAAHIFDQARDGPVVTTSVFLVDVRAKERDVPHLATGLRLRLAV